MQLLGENIVKICGCTDQLNLIGPLTVPCSVCAMMPQIILILLNHCYLFIFQIVPYIDN